MNYLKQIWYEMRHQKMMTWVSVSGTALSIFLVMAFFMTKQAKVVEMAPESNRSRILIGQNFHVKNTSKEQQGDGSAAISYEYARKIYEGLDGVERVSYINAWETTRDASVGDGEIMTVFTRLADDEFWNIYDFRFIDGKPYDKAEATSGANRVVISQSLARRLFGEEKVAGREIVVDCMPYVVSGVIEDVNPLFSTSYAQLYMVFDKNVNDEGNWFGDSQAVLLLKEGTDIGSVKRQVESRYATFNAEKKSEGREAIYHDQPYTVEEVSIGGYGSNNGPDKKGNDIVNYITYAILIILPAINLSSMTRSRLRHRVTEIGVRRAFGAKKSAIVTQMFGENLIITIVGGAIGLVLSIAFVWLASSLFFDMAGKLDPSSLDMVNARPTLAMLFTWKNFLIALGLCFILNILSATVPAWKASKVAPAVAIAKSR